MGITAFSKAHLVLSNKLNGMGIHYSLTPNTLWIRASPMRNAILKS